VIMALLIWLQNLSVVTWIRESESLLGYTLYLAGHTIGLVFLVGPTLVIAARVLGIAPDLPLRPMARFRPVIISGLVLTVVTGLVLFATAPVGYVHNVVFIVKIAAIIAAVLCLNALLRNLFAGVANPDENPITLRARSLTSATLVFWVIAVVAGRLTAYSGVVVIASLAAFMVVVVNAAWIVALSRFVLTRRDQVPKAALTYARATPANGGK